MEEISRFSLSGGKIPDFFKKIFTTAEINYCLSKHNPPQHFAARFAAKEATYKALAGEKGGEAISLTEIEVKNSGSGAPIVKLPAPFSTRYDLCISISHCGDKAVAIATASKKCMEK